MRRSRLIPPSLHRSSGRATGRVFPYYAARLKLRDIAPVVNPLRPIGSRGAAPGYGALSLLIGRSMRTLPNIANSS